jgi:5-methylcytosine-specific restriction endonuclease McrA
MARQYKGRKSNYRKSLNTDYWKNVCREVRLRDDHECQICEKKTSLEVHHKTYKKNGISIIGKELENLDCLILLCADCHNKIHNK